MNHRTRKGDLFSRFSRRRRNTGGTGGAGSQQAQTAPDSGSMRENRTKPGEGIRGTVRASTPAAQICPESRLFKRRRGCTFDSRSLLRWRCWRATEEHNRFLRWMNQPLEGEFSSAVCHPQCHTSRSVGRRADRILPRHLSRVPRATETQQVLAIGGIGGIGPIAPMFWARQCVGSTTAPESPLGGESRLPVTAAYWAGAAP